MEVEWNLTDPLGPEKVIFLQDAAVGLKAILVVDNTACGPAIGGCRMASDATLEECQRLARSMTLKNAAARLPHGGGKSIIIADPRMRTASKESIMRSFARRIGEIESYIVGPDMGTDEQCMAWCNDEIGRSVGLPPELGGIPLDEIGATGYGLRIAAKALEPQLGFALGEARATIQGFGAVGKFAAKFLAELGVRIVAVSDSTSAVRNDNGLDVTTLIAHKRNAGSVGDFDGGHAITPSQLLDVETEFLIPAARPDVITLDNAGNIPARVILPGANIAVSDAAEPVLRARGVLSVPDFIANAGGVICAHVEYHGGNQTQAFARIEDTISDNVVEVVNRARNRQTVPRDEALSLARERVLAAASYRRR